MVVTFLIQGPKTPEMKNKNKVFLGGLPANVTETIIRQAFEPFGQVSEFFLTYFAQQFACTYLQTCKYSLATYKDLLRNLQLAYLQLSQVLTHRSQNLETYNIQ